MVTTICKLLRVSHVVFMACVLAAAASSSSSNNGTDNGNRTKKTLHLLGLVPLTSETVPVGHVVMPAVNLALQQINARDDILPEYELKLHWRDTWCEIGHGIDALYRLLLSPPVKIMIVGPACSTACEAIAQTTLLWNITHMAYGCKTPSLSDRTRFPHFFRGTASETSTIPVFLELLKFYNWKKVALIHEAMEYWSKYAEELHTAFDVANVTVVRSEIFLGDPSLQVLNLQKHDVRIVVGGFYAGSALKVLCEAYKIGFYGPRIVWLFVSHYLEDYWHSAAKNTDCTPEEILVVIRTSVLYAGIDQSNPDTFHTPAISNITRAEAYSYLEATIGRDTSAKVYFPYFYDPVWATAVVLNRTAETMKQTGFPRRLEDFTYADTEMTDLISSSVEGMQFQGLSGSLKWKEKNFPDVDMLIEQQAGERRAVAGRYRVGVDHIEWSERGIVWESHPPRDSEVTIFKVVSVNSGLYTLMCCLTSLGIAFSMALLAFNVFFRETRVIKMSSPNINNVMLVGCLISYTNVFFNPTKNEVVSAQGSCIATLSTLLVGFSLMFGALFSKTWRIHVIMRNSKTMKKVIIKDSKLVVIVLGLVLVDVFVIVVWQSVDLFKVVINNGTPAESSTDPDVWIVPQATGCQSKYETYFSAVLYGIQGLMLAFGAFLAWETRQVKVAALNDSKEIGMCIYNVLILGVMGVLINLVVDDIDVKYGFSSATILAATALVQGLIFVPKILAVRRGDQGGVGPSSVAPSTNTHHGIVSSSPAPDTNNGT